MEHNPLFAVWINRPAQVRRRLAGIRVHGDPLPARHHGHDRHLALSFAVLQADQNLSLPGQDADLLESIYFFRNIVDDMIGRGAQVSFRCWDARPVHRPFQPARLAGNGFTDSQPERPGRMRCLHLPLLPLQGSKSTASSAT
jgi:hypothetical protein